jgi:hypothetical protein
MPGMPRIPGKAKEIAYKILGVPDNMKKQKRVNRKIDKRLVFEETQRVK